MKILLILSSCFMAVNWSTAQTNFSLGKADTLEHVTLQNIVLEHLNIPNGMIAHEFVNCFHIPGNTSDRVVIVPEIENEQFEDEELYYELTSHIFVLDAYTGEIKNSYTEPSESNGWVSDAIIMSDIVVDTTLYNLGNKQDVFGIKCSNWTMSHPNPYSSSFLSLYTLEKDTLLKILDYLIVYEYSGEVNISGDCAGNLIIESEDLSIDTTATNGYYDLIVHHKVKEIEIQEGTQGDCVEKSDSIITRSVLKFDSNTYK